MKRLGLILGLMIASVLGIVAQNIKFTANAPSAVVKGEQFQLVYSINAEARDLRAPELSAFQVLYGPTKSSYSSMQVINGTVTSDVSSSFTYVLMANKEGSYSIPSATISVNGKQYTSNALNVKVLPPDKAAAQQKSNKGGGNSTTNSTSISEDNLFAKLNLSSRRIYEQDYVLATIKLYSRYEVGLENFKLPEFDGFLAEDIPITDPQWSVENYNGVNYRTVILKKALLFPQRTGNLKIGSCKFNLVVRIKAKQQGGNFFDDFFETYQDVRKIITTAPTSLEVTPLPAGKPASFNGAVGSYSLKSTITSSHVKANEAVTVRVTIAGAGNIKLLKNPTITFPADFEAYDPKITNNIKTTVSGITGNRVIEYLAIPRIPGKFVIPSAEFTYFDPKSSKYVTLKTESYELQVDKGVGGGNSQQVVSDFTNKESVRVLGKDIQYIRTAPFELTQSNRFLFGTTIYWLLYIVPFFLFLVLSLVFRKKAQENANKALMRTKQANKVATKRLKMANKYLAQSNKNAFYQEMLRAVWGYLSDKLSIPVSALTKENIELELTKYGVADELILKFREILDTCEFAQYAPAQSSDEMQHIYDNTVDAIGVMEKVVKK